MHVFVRLLWFWQVVTFYIGTSANQGIIKAYLLLSGIGRWIHSICSACIPEVHKYHPDPTTGKGFNWLICRYLIHIVWSFFLYCYFVSFAFLISWYYSHLFKGIFCSVFQIHYLEYLLQVDSVAAGAQYDKEFVVCCLDLLSGLVEGLGSGIESLVISLFPNLTWKSPKRKCILTNKRYFWVLIPRTWWLLLPITFH